MSKLNLKSSSFQLPMAKVAIHAKFTLDLMGFMVSLSKTYNFLAFFLCKSHTSRALFPKKIVMSFLQMGIKCYW